MVNQKTTSLVCHNNQSSIKQTKHLYMIFPFKNKKSGLSHKSWSQACGVSCTSAITSRQAIADRLVSYSFYVLFGSFYVLFGCLGLSSVCLGLFGCLFWVFV